MAAIGLSLHDLAKRHQDNTPSVARMTDGEVLLWYADLNVEVQGERVRYLCPKCGTVMATPVEEFVHYEWNDDALLCLPCRGDPEERNAGL